MQARKLKETSCNKFQNAADTLIDQFRTQRPIRAGSLVISIFGDAISPHGGAVWLGSLIDAMAPFGINQRLVRTSVFRLVKDGWLQSEQIGRRSYYSLTDKGRTRFQDASRHIYSELRSQWDETWCLVILNGLDTGQRDEMRRELNWLGFAAISANVLVHPTPDRDALNDRLGSVPGNDKLLIMSARADSDRGKHLRELVSQSWSLNELDNRYQQFLIQFRPVYSAAIAAKNLDNEAAFHVRTLLIHEYRRIQLRDPLLPDALLPSRFGGRPAYQLCRNIYSLVAEATERFLTEHMETADGPLPPADPSFFKRFGGLNN